LAYFVTVPRKSKSPALCEVALDQPCRVTRKIEFAGSRLTGLAISSSRNRIYVSDADNEQIHIVDLTKFKSIDSWDVAHEIGSLVLNPADDMLAALCPLSREIRVFDPDDGAELGSVIGLRSGAFDLKFSPKGDEIYAIHCEPENCIAVVDTKPLLSKCRIVFSSNRSESGQQLFIVGEDGKDVRQLTHVKGKASLPRWSPDGRKIAFLTNDKGLKICVIKRNGDLVKVFENTDPTLRAVSANFAVMDWAPDGSQIAFIGKEDRAIRAVDVKTGNIRTLFDGSIPGYNMHVSLTWDSRDGSLLVASRGQDTSDRFVISRFEPKTKEFRPIFRSDELSYTFNGPAVSPVGDKIAVFRQDKNKPAHAQPLYLLNSKGGDPQALASTGTTINSYPRWTTRGSSLVYAGRDRKQTHVYLLRLPDGKPDQLTRGDCDDFAPDVWGEPDGE
jgi:Tol biopolymer transport system component